MTDPKANELIKALIADLDKEFDPAKTAEALKAIRPFALKEEDPLVTKVLRLAYQHLENNDSFEIQIEEEEEDENGEMILVEVDERTDAENVQHMISLMLNNQNEYNRIDLQSYRDLLYEEL